METNDDRMMESGQHYMPRSFHNLVQGLGPLRLGKFASLEENREIYYVEGIHLYKCIYFDKQVIEFL
jgi:hypothetical protein